ncbi:MAG: phage holin family protein [Clostridiales bacterium]
MDITMLTNYIKPELLILIPVLYFIGIGLKNTQALNDKYIPLTLGIIGILMSLIWVLAVSIFATWQDVFTAIFTAIVQGVLVAGCSVYADQLVKQVKRE